MGIQPVSNNRLTLLRKLQRKKYRQKEHLFIIEGERAVEQVINNGFVPVEGLFFDASQQLWSASNWQANSRRAETYIVDPSDFQDITDTDNPQGVLALCRMPAEIALGDLANSHGVLIATDGIQDPGNLGTMLRTASWFGAKGVLAGKGTVDLFHPKVVRSTAGATGTLPYRNADLDSDLPLLEQANWKVVLLSSGPDATDLKAMENFEKVILVVGNEANGIRNSLSVAGRMKGCITSPVSTPDVESLNAAVALSIALYAFSQ